MEKKTFLGSIMRGDSWIWGIYWVLFFISVVEMFSASSRLVHRSMTSTDPVFHHMEFLFWGLGAVLVFQSFSVKALRNWSLLFYVGGLILLVALFAKGDRVQGATRAVFGIQPSEICKVGLMMILSLAITKKDEFFLKWKIFRKNTQLARFILYLLLAGMVALPIMTQNLSTALIIGMATLAVMWMGKVKGKYLIYVILGVAAAGSLFLSALFGLYKWDESNRTAGQKTVDLAFLNRAHTWANRIYGKDSVPLADQNPNDDNAQVIYAHMALANSYPFGRFIGNSQLRDHLPEAYSDYIYAIIFEETGFVGALIVMLLYLVLVGRSFYLSTKTNDQFVRLLMIALPTIMTIQALIHIGVCTDAMFVTGQPLPLISRGGSSILFTSVSFGIILALSRIIKAEREATGDKRQVISGDEGVPQVQIETI